MIDPAHFEAAFAHKPRGRVMVYRDWLCSLSSQVSAYLQQFCHKRRTEMKQQMIALYDVAQEIGKADFVAALELAAEQQMYGAEYIRAIGVLPSAPVPDSSAQMVLSPLPLAVPPQHEVERDLARLTNSMLPTETVWS